MSVENKYPEIATEAVFQEVLLRYRQKEKNKPELKNYIVSDESLRKRFIKMINFKGDKGRFN